MKTKTKIATFTLLAIASSHTAIFAATPAKYGACTTLAKSAYGTVSNAAKSVTPWVVVTGPLAVKNAKQLGTSLGSGAPGDCKQVAIEAWNNPKAAASNAKTAIVDYGKATVAKVTGAVSAAYKKVTGKK